MTIMIHQMLHVISNWLIVLNSASNFFIYCLAGAKFRQVMMITLVMMMTLVMMIMLLMVIFFF